jgi:hypothetical protein
MSADGSIVIEWGGDEYKFRLAIGEMRDLFEFINKPRVAIGAPMIGPMTLLQTLEKGDGWPNEIREIIRLGLIGGGMKTDRALVLIKTLVEPPGHLLSAHVVAYKVLMSAISPVEDEENPVGKNGPAADGMAPPTGSALQPSTGPALQ